MVVSVLSGNHFHFHFSPLFPFIRFSNSFAFTKDPGIHAISEIYAQPWESWEHKKFPFFRYSMNIFPLFIFIWSLDAINIVQNGFYVTLHHPNSSTQDHLDNPWSQHFSSFCDDVNFVQNLQLFPRLFEAAMNPLEVCELDAKLGIS